MCPPFRRALFCVTYRRLPPNPPQKFSAAFMCQNLIWPLPFWNRRFYAAPCILGERINAEADIIVYTLSYNGRGLCRSCTAPARCLYPLQHHGGGSRCWPYRRWNLCAPEKLGIRRYGLTFFCCSKNSSQHRRSPQRTSCRKSTRKPHPKTSPPPSWPQSRQKS